MEINEVEHILTPEDGEVTLPAGPHHRLWATPVEEREGEDAKVVFLISASLNSRTTMLDQAFFENWYGYQEDMMLRGTEPDLIQVCSVSVPFLFYPHTKESRQHNIVATLLHFAQPLLTNSRQMFEAGDSYLSPPAWVPFRHFFGYWLTLILGHYIGSLLGYQPFHPEWTTDWDAACTKMEQSWFQRKFAKREAKDIAKRRFDENGDLVVKYAPDGRKMVPDGRDRWRLEKE